VLDFRNYRVRRRLQMSYALSNACQKENERISTMPFLLSHFSPGDKIENCSAQFLGLGEVDANNERDSVFTAEFMNRARPLLSRLDA
jgi:hypothetical protein